MNFNAKKTLNLEFITIAFLFLGLCLMGGNASADMVQTPDRLEQLSKTLEQGSYNPEDKVKEASKKFINVNPEDYSRLKIKPLYSDSEITYNEESKEYFEVRDFQNNITMIYNINENHLTVVDIDEDDPAEESWNVSCRKDRITDEKICYLNKYQLAIIKSNKNALLLTVSKKAESLNLRENNYIRIDNNPAHKSRSFYKGQSALNIINEAKIGKTAYTRFYEWDGEMYEEIIPLWGFSVAYDVMNKMFARIK